MSDAKMLRELIDTELALVDLAAKDLDSQPTEAPRSALINVRVPESLKSAFEGIARLEGPDVSIGDIHRRALVRYLKAYSRELQEGARVRAMTSETKELLRHLPPGELPEEASFNFKWDRMRAYQGDYEYWTEGKGETYRRYKGPAGPNRIAIFRDGVLIEETTSG